MTALTADRNTPRRDGELVSDPLAAAAVLYVGAMYALDNSGNAVAATAAGNTVRAVAQEQVSLAAGDSRVEGRRSTYLFDNSAGAGELTRADIGKVAYVADDQTVSKTGTAVAGLVIDIEDGQVWVDVSQAPVLAAAIAAAAAP
ncbi:hypothetical protein [Pigmentiphaga kullae]|uniref:Uncharacterized protein n=1 Tax=Pigmentiphaga kullae TaxID=151784 RepID=A0A4Q7NLP8_9BURK|nr:hypothetical protein [Pigmentiphaga kullae]RZS86065.1 hypothetical protein EV675_2099 [Pigmentiphaga kullae]